MPRSLSYHHLCAGGAFGAVCSAVVALFLSSADPARAAGSYVIDENFDEMTTGVPPAGWTAVATSGTVSVQPISYASDHGVQIQKLATSGTSLLGQTISAQSGKVAIEARVMAAETTGYKCAPYIYGPDGTTIISIAFKDGNIASYVGSTLTTLQSFVANEWYQIRVVIDTSANTYDLWIDGVQQLTGAAVRHADASVGRFSFYMDETNTGTMFVDRVKVFTIAGFIGAPPSPVFDVRDFGAAGDGVTDDQEAIQSAIDACAGTGGSVYLSGGTFLTGMLDLGSDMTFFIDYGATLKATVNAADYPTLSPPTTNNQLSNCQKAFLYAEGVENLTFDGGGTIDGSGTNAAWVGTSVAAAARPITIWTVLSDNVTIQNLSIRRSAMWTVVNMETDYLTVSDLLLNVNISANRDGIDTVDCQHGVIQDCAVYTGDDAFCFKSGIRRGVDDFVVKDCFVAHTSANAYKFGTASYGGFSNVTIQDCYAKQTRFAAMEVMSRNGADAFDINYMRMNFSSCGAAFFVFLGQQPGHPAGDVNKMGSINNVHFSTISGTATGQWDSLITGQIYSGATYRITNLFFTDCTISFAGGLTTIPAAPPEWNSSTYPDVDIFGNLPAAACYFRHVDGTTFTRCAFTLAASDARPITAMDDTLNALTRVFTDGGSIPDDWELQYFGATGIDPNADPDGDGLTNYEEFMAGTNPLDPNDRFGVTGFSSNAGVFTVTFSTVPNKRYQPEYTDDLASGAWLPLGNIQSNQTNSLSITDTPPPGQTSRFYRLCVLPD